MILKPWQVAYIKWLANKVKVEDSWTEDEIQEAAKTTEFRCDLADSFQGGYQEGAKDSIQGLRRTK